MQICDKYSYSSWISSVSEILHNLDLPTLEECRKNLKLLMMYKMMHGQVESGNCLVQAQSRTRGHNQRFPQPYTQELMLICFLIIFSFNDQIME